MIAFTWSVIANSAPDIAFPSSALSARSSATTTTFTPPIVAKFRRCVSPIRPKPRKATPIVCLLLIMLCYLVTRFNVMHNFPSKSIFLSSKQRFQVDAVFASDRRRVIRSCILLEDQPTVVPMLFKRLNYRRNNDNPLPEPREDKAFECSVKTPSILKRPLEDSPSTSLRWT